MRSANREKTHCSKGHPFSGPNLWLRHDGRRICAECNRERFRAWYQRTFHGEAVA